jgi:hypothetical protein
MFPLPTAAVFSRGDSDMDVYGDNASLFLSWYYKIQRSLLYEQCQRYGAHLIEYPSEWLDRGLTPDVYGTYEPWHMNAEFGELVMKGLLQKYI